MTSDKKEKKVKLTYEDALQALEEIVRKLEQGDIQLEEALQVYQKGVELAAYCSHILNKVEEKMTILQTNKGEK